MSNNKLKFVLLVFILVAVAFSHAFNFHLYVDDWIQIMGALHYPGVLLYYANVHPGTALEFKILSPLFQFNPFPWQFLGYLLKVIATLSIVPLMYALTGSKRISLYSCLIFAVFGEGIESFVFASASSSALIIPLINMGFYFWIISIKDRLDRNFFAALFLLALSILIEPGRAFMVIILASVWEGLSLYQQINLMKMRVSSLKIYLLFSLAPLINSILKEFVDLNVKPSFIILQLFTVFNENQIDLYKNLLFGWTLLSGKISQRFIELFTIAFFVAFFGCLILFLVKKRSLYKNIIFLSLWTLLFYVVNSTRNHLGGEFMESRYYTLSTVGLVGLLAYGFSLIRSRYVNVLFALFLIFNLYVTNNILLQTATYRSVQNFNKVWDKIEQDVPKGEIGSIFMITGDEGSNRGRIIDGSGSYTIPFSAKRNIIAREDQPVLTNDEKLIAKLICNKGVVIINPLIGNIYKDQMSLSHLHAWEIKNGELENRSGQARESIEKIATCL